MMITTGVKIRGNQEVLLASQARLVRKSQCKEGLLP